MLPNFLVIGTQRAGTTWLHNSLSEHPEIFLPAQKELLFFSKHFHLGSNYYSSYFDKANSEKAIGEISPEYLYCDKCHYRISKLLPNAKLIVILRNPIERAYSAYEIFTKNLTGWSFEEAISKRPGLLTSGLYYEQIEKYLTVFKKEHMLILLYDDLKKDNLRFLKSVYSFLEVDQNFVPSWIGKSVNTVSFPRVRSFLGHCRLEFLIDIIKMTPIEPMLRKIATNQKSRSKPNIAPHVKGQLLMYYRESNTRLSQLINRDLSLWEK